MKSPYLKIGLLALALAFSAACNKKKDSGAEVSGGGRDARVAGPSNLPTGQGNTAGTQAAYVVVADQHQAAFEAAVKGLVSATIQPESVGSIDNRTGVEISGDVGVNPQTGQVQTESRLQIVVRDSMVGTDDGNGGSVNPIVIMIKNASGTAANYQANLSFSDEFGTITITGQYDNQNFHGKVQYNNKNSRSGTIGDFVIPTCAFFRCM